MCNLSHKWQFESDGEKSGEKHLKSFKRLYFNELINKWRLEIPHMVSKNSVFTRIISRLSLKAPYWNLSSPWSFLAAWDFTQSTCSK